jgi:hypothetical protein
VSIDAVLDANARYWGAEAEICRTYFRSPSRTATTDAAWLARQAAKELLDGVVPRMRQLDRALAAGAIESSPVADIAEELHEEAVHFRAFAAAHARVRPAGIGDLDLATLKAAVAWPANLALAAVRARHTERDRQLGAVAGSVTEGGCCALFREGIALAGGSEADDAIAEACRAVLADEAEHMLSGLAAVDEIGLRPEQWEVVVDMSVEQSRARLLMREEQFGGAVGPDRLAQLLESGAEPLLPT